MDIILEPYSSELSSAIRQGRAIRGAFAGETDWLERYYERTARRNRDTWHAIKNVVRLARLTDQSGERHSYLVQHSGRTVRTLGTATVILDGKVRNPTNTDIIHAHDVDYAVKHSTAKNIHKAIGQALVHEAVRLHVEKYGQRDDADATIPPYRLMATVDPENPYPPIGVVKLEGMRPIGTPAVLLTESGEDYHQLDRGRAVLQLYATGMLTDFSALSEGTIA